uniref:B30.2/SPRY domain-containing protein n=1 Tax=Salmo trutta TaxID=8032 RepID=A0A674DT04_SALTR
NYSSQSLCCPVCPLSLSLSLSLSVSLSLSLCPSLSVPLSLSVPPLSLCPSVSLCPSLSVSLCVPLSLCLCPPVPLSVSPLSLCLCPPVPLSVSPPLSVSLSLGLSVPLCPSLSPSVPLSLSLSFSVSVSLCLSLSLSLSLPLSLSLSVCLSLSLSVPLSLSVSLSLQSYQSLSSISVSSDLPSIVVRPLQYFGDVSKTVSELREKLEDFLKGEWTKISTTVNIVEVVLPPEPKTREQLLQYSWQLTLDPNTAHTLLSLSEGNRKVTFIGQVQPYPNHPDRFTNQWQVLCREGLSGRCYWEVEWTGYVYTAVSYKDISKTGSDNIFGDNNKSWSLQYHCSRGDYCFRHNNVVTKVSGPQSSRVGVYLDHKAGTLSFYSVSDTMTLLHRVQTTFTQPLYPGFSFTYLSLYGTAELVEL